MSSANERGWFRSVSSRLAATYAALFLVSAAAGFAILYALVSAYLLTETDTALIDQAEELSYYVKDSSLEQLQTELGRAAHAQGTQNIFIRLLTDTEETLCSSSLEGWSYEHPREAETLGSRSEPFFATVDNQADAGEIRLLYYPLDENHTLNIGISLRSDNAMLNRLRSVAFLMGILMAALGGLVGWFMARKAMRGVEEVTRTAKRIADGHMDERVPVAVHGEEIDQLAAAFNTMIERIHRLMGEMKETNDNIAHDLRSPLTRMRGAAEASLMDNQEKEDYRQMAGTVVEECDRLLSMINTMLDISETEAGVSRLSMVKVDLHALALEAVDLFSPVAEERDVSLRCEAGSCEHMHVLGDLRRLQRLLANLIDNALKYTPPGGSVCVSVQNAEGMVALSVKDTGDGVAAEEQTRIFDRFYRSDASRGVGGNGLGLSLAQAIARAHGGRIELSSAPGKGSAFKLSLPLHPPPTPPR